MININVQIDVEKLQKTKIFIATPMYGGQCSGTFTKSCISLQKLFSEYGMDCQFHIVLGDSLVTRARNILVDLFLSSDCTHLLFIDSDIEFNPHDVFTFLYFDKDVTVAPYAKKYIRWDKVISAVKNNPNVQPQELEKIAGSPVINFTSGTNKFKSYEPLEVKEAGTGFMMIKREVFDKLKLEYPSLKYKSDFDSHVLSENPKYYYSFFDTTIDTKDSIIGGGSERYLSEDYTFCRLWTNIGGQIFICPWMVTKHFGSIGFVSDLGLVSNLTGSM